MNQMRTQDSPEGNTTPHVEDPMKIVHKDQDGISAFCINQVCFLFLIIIVLIFCFNYLKGFGNFTTFLQIYHFLCTFFEVKCIFMSRMQMGSIFICKNTHLHICDIKLILFIVLYLISC